MIRLQSKLSMVRQDRKTANNTTHSAQNFASASCTFGHNNGSHTRSVTENPSLFKGTPFSLRPKGARECPPPLTPRRERLGESDGKGSKSNRVCEPAANFVWQPRDPTPASNAVNSMPPRRNAYAETRSTTTPASFPLLF